MSEYAYEVYESIIQATSSELILFFIIIAVMAIPLYIVVLKGRKADKQHEREREKQILEVIKENSAVIAGLKTTLDSSGETTKNTLERIHTRIDSLESASKGIATGVAQIEVKVDNSSKNQIEMASKINKVLLIVDSIPNNSSFSTQNGGEQERRGL